MEEEKEEGFRKLMCESEGYFEVMDIRLLYVV
jgi:hypothetical protein